MHLLTSTFSGYGVCHLGHQLMPDFSGYNGWVFVKAKDKFPNVNKKIICGLLVSNRFKTQTPMWIHSFVVFKRANMGSPAIYVVELRIRLEEKI